MAGIESTHPVAESSLVDHLILIDKSEKNDFRWTNLRHLVKKYLSEFVRGDTAGLKILDLGCGTGHLALDLLQRGYDVSAVDNSRELVDFANHKAHEAGCQLNVSQVDVLKLPYREAFHAVISLDVLEHVEDDRLALANIYSALKCGGILICSVPALSVLYGKRDVDIGHFRRYDKDKLIEEIESSGFTLCSVRYWNCLGLIPVALFEKVFHRRVYEKNRYSQSLPQRALNALLDRWFSLVENRIRPPLGLTLIAIARKP